MKPICVVVLGNSLFCWRMPLIKHKLIGKLYKEVRLLYLFLIGFSVRHPKINSVPLTFINISIEFINISILTLQTG